jgi:hypothetical protein
VTPEWEYAAGSAEPKTARNGFEDQAGPEGWWVVRVGAHGVEVRVRSWSMHHDVRALRLAERIADGHRDA